MAQPQCVPDLVDDDLLQVGEHERLRLQALRVELVAGLEQVEREVELDRRGIGDRAGVHVVRVAGRGVGQRQRELLDALAAPAAQARGIDADVGVEDLTAARVDLARPDAAERRTRRREPAHRRVPRIERVPVGVVGLHLRLDGIAVADALERLVPFEDALDHRRAVALGNVAVEPEHDRLHGLRQRRARILLLEPPALDVVHARRQRVVVRVIETRTGEVADAIVRRARGHRRIGQLREVVVEPEEEAPDVRHGRRRRRRGRRAGRGRRLDDAGERVMRADVESRELGRAARLGDRRIADVERIRLPIGALELAVGGRNIGEQQRVDLDQHRFALGMRLRNDRHAGDEAVGKRLADAQRLRRLRLREEVRVDRRQLHLLALLAEQHEIAVAHQPGEEELLAQAPRQVHRKEIGLVELLGRELHPDLVVLLPDAEEARRFPGVLDHVGKGPRSARDLRRRGRGARGGGRAGAGGAVVRRGAGRRRRRRRRLRRRRAGGAQEGERQCRDAKRTELHVKNLLRDEGAAPRHAVASSPRNECGCAAVMRTST